MHASLLLSLTLALGTDVAEPAAPPAPPLAPAPATTEMPPPASPPPAPATTETAPPTPAPPAPATTETAPSTPTPPAPGAAEKPAGATTRKITLVVLQDGQELRGELVSETPEAVVLKLPSGGRVELARAAIKKLETQEVKVRPGGQEWWFEDPNRSRYLYAPSAMMLRPGECYFSQKELLFSAFGCGLHSNVSVLFGTAVPFWFYLPTSGSGMNAVAAMKVGSPVGDVFHLAGGFEAFLLPGFGSLNMAGFLFGSATAGNPNAHATLSVGKTFSFSSSSPGALGEAIIVLSGNLRVSPNIALVTENWLLPYLSRQELIMFNGLALRFLGPHWTVDMGLVRAHTFTIPVPWLDFTYNFG